MTALHRLRAAVASLVAEHGFGAGGIIVVAHA